MPDETSENGLGSTNDVINTPGSVTNALKEKLLYDVFTTLKYLDSLDSGFSIMIRVPGSFHLDPDAETLVPKDAEVDVAKLMMTCYINTESLEKCKAYGPVAQVVQTFAEGIACAHLTHLKAICVANGFTLKTHVPPPEPEDEFPLVPRPESGHSCYYKIQGLRPGLLKARLTELEDVEFERMEDDVDWKSVEKETATVEEDMMAKLARLKYACLYCMDIDSDREFKGLPPILSFGPRTDRIMKLIEFPDRQIPYIYHMITRERSSRWTECLEGGEFCLPHDQANILSMALQDDAKEAQTESIKDAKLDSDDKSTPAEKNIHIQDAKLDSDDKLTPVEKNIHIQDAKLDSDDKFRPTDEKERYSRRWSIFKTIIQIILTIVAYEFLLSNLLIF